MRRIASLAVCTLVACSSHKSPLDDLHAGTPDPWASPSASIASVASSGTKSKDDDGPLGGIDLKGLLDKLTTGLKTPGPYEAARKSADYDESKPHWAVLEFGGAVVEKTAFSIRGGKGLELGDVIGRFRALAKDVRVTGLLVRFDGVQISVPDLVELRVALHDFRATGKPLACHAEGADEATYQLMAACDRIGLAPLGELGITGPTAMPVHLKPLLDKLGVVADFLHVGAYKGAAEPLTRDAPSKEMEEVLGTILDRRYDTLIDIVATERKLEPAAVKALVDLGLFPADDARTAKLVDDVAAFEAFRADVVKGPWTTIELKEDRSKLEDIQLVLRFFGMSPPDRPTTDHVAVVYAIGDIVDGSGDGILGARQQIASQTLIATLRTITDDKSVKAVVLRIDSGGGSAQASELIWRAVAELVAKKPVIVSMSDVAASGGYYIASGATKIYAMPDTLTGSIGVVGGKLALGPALAKLGVSTFPMGRGKHATMMASMRPWTDDEKVTIQNTMASVYKVFLGRVADGRKKTFAQVEEIAQGRVWTGTDALKHGLVDELGGLDAALADARKRGGVDAKADLEIYPAAPTMRDILSSYGMVQTSLAGSAILDQIRAADPHLANAVESLLRLALSFQTTRIQTVALLPVIP